MLVRCEDDCLVRETVFIENRLEEINACELVLDPILYPDHIRHDYYLFIEHLIDPKEILEDDLHDPCADHLYNFNPLGLEAILNDAIVVLGVIVHPEDDLIGASPRQRHLLYLSCLWLHSKVIGVNHKIGERRKEHFLFFLKI